MIIPFSKYHGAGNDFIMIDNRSSLMRNTENSVDLISRLCNRRLGIGADGLILLNNSNTADFEMIYFNSDGRAGTMCGNGGRCCVAFADNIGINKKKIIFAAVDGLHEAIIIKNEKNCAIVRLKMQDVSGIRNIAGNYVIDTGSPHFVNFVDDVEKYDVFNNGRKIRYNRAFKKFGINVNFAEVKSDGLFVRTYERGVEEETLSCGTGAVASSIAASLSGVCKKEGYSLVHTRGGDLVVRFNKVSEESFNDIWLEGPAEYVYNGKINI